MTKNEYLALLYEHLKNMSETEKQDIVSEYENHFIEGLNDGKTEQQIVKMLGHPKDMAKAINAESAVGEAEKHKGFSNTGQAIITVLGLSVINFILITGPLLIYISLLISLAFVGLIGLAAPFFSVLSTKVYNSPCFNFRLVCSDRVAWLRYHARRFNHYYCEMELLDCH